MAISKMIKFEPVATDSAIPINTEWKRIPASSRTTCKRFFCCCWASVSLTPRPRGPGGLCSLPPLLPVDDAWLELECLRVRRPGVMWMGMVVVVVVDDDGTMGDPLAMRRSASWVDESLSLSESERSEASDVMVGRWGFAGDNRSIEIFSLHHKS